MAAVEGRRRSPTVAGAVQDVGPDPVPVTALVDAVLSRHPDYTRGWPTTQPVWSEDVLVQSAKQWMREVEALVLGELLFGRAAVLGWCLLDTVVAQAASGCGLLAAISDGIRPSAPELLTPEGRRLLQQRAPLVALSAGLLAPAVDLKGVAGGGAIEHVALTRLPQGQRGVGTWAASSGDRVFVGSGATSRRVNEDAASTPVTMSFTRQGNLQALDFAGQVVQRYRPSDGRLATDEWRRGVWTLASSEGGIVGYDHQGRSVAWGAADGGAPVDLDGPDRGEVHTLAVANDRVAAATEGEIWFGGPDHPWRLVGIEQSGPEAMAADDSGVSYGTDDGWVRSRAWVPDAESSPDPQAWERAHALPGQRILMTARGGGRSVVASETEIAVVRDGAVEARWSPEDSATITAVALSPDGGTLAVAGTLMLRIWRIDGAGEIRLTSYTADTPDGVDLLGVQPTADALAALIAARAVEPPLSIGLFGAWGSGKSFFMRLVRDRVRQITDESRSSERPQAAMWAWRNVRHVEFNAWQYAAADVWAGLLEQLVAELSRPVGGTTLELPLPDELSALEKNRVERLAGAVTSSQDAVNRLSDARGRRDEARLAVSSAQEQVQVARVGVAQARQDATMEVAESGAVVALDAALRTAGLPEVGGDVQQAFRQVAEARRSTESVGELLRGRHGWALTAVIGGPAVGVLVGVLLAVLSAEAPWLTGAVTALLTTLATGAAWLQRSAEDMRTKVDLIAAAEAQARLVEAGARAKLAAAQARLGEAELAVAGSERAAVAAEHEVAAAEADVAASSTGSLVEEYLTGRQASNDYRTQLGLIGTVRRDLDVISRGVVRHNQELVAQPDAPRDDIVNRVVLYVDDLDRCRPEVVVKVLEAVAMLMSFPLFVVVVAVDSHWISRSLRQVYKEMLSDGEVTPDNYLEKIFQLPVWLDRPGADTTATMTRALLGDGETSAAPTGNAAAPSPSTSVAAGAETSSGARRTSSPAVRARDIALATTPPESIVLDPSETAAIAALAPLLTRSPRALKRYLNTYRVLKAIVDPSALELARVLLAVATGRPEVGEALLSAIRPGAQPRSIGDAIATLSEDDRAWLALVPDTSWQQVPCSQAWPVGQHVRRFVFRSEPDPSPRVAP